VYQDIASTLVEGGGIGEIIIFFSKAFDLVLHNQLLTELATSGHGYKGSCLGKELYCRSYRNGNNRRVTVRGNGCNLTCAISERFGSLLFVVYINSIRMNIDVCVRLLLIIIYRKITKLTWKSCRRIWEPCGMG
jgi:hypothetical protein